MARLAAECNLLTPAHRAVVLRDTDDDLVATTVLKGEWVSIGVVLFEKMLFVVVFSSFHC